MTDNQYIANNTHSSYQSYKTALQNINSTILTIFHIQTANHERHQSAHRHRAHDLAIAVVRAQGQRALAQMGHALGQTDAK